MPSIFRTQSLSKTFNVVGIPLETVHDFEYLNVLNLHRQVTGLELTLCSEEEAGAAEVCAAGPQGWPGSLRTPGASPTPWGKCSHFWGDPSCQYHPCRVYWGEKN
jgi:hypothetical protein